MSGDLDGELQALGRRRGAGGRGRDGREEWVSNKTEIEGGRESGRETKGRQGEDPVRAVKRKEKKEMGMGWTGGGENKSTVPSDLAALSFI